MHSAPEIHCRIYLSGVRAFVRSLETFPRWPRTPTHKPLLCRCGFHRWGPWDIRSRYWRVIEKKCRRCGVVRVRRFGGSALT